MSSVIEDQGRALFGETKVSCPNCKGTAYVTGVDRSRGKWTCYGCGLVNRFEAPPVEDDKKP